MLSKNWSYMFHQTSLDQKLIPTLSRQWNQKWYDRLKNIIFIGYLRTSITLHYEIMPISTILAYWHMFLWILCCVPARSNDVNKIPISNTETIFISSSYQRHWVDIRDLIMINIHGTCESFEIITKEHVKSIWYFSGFYFRRSSLQ